ncbi:hypothetical protein [Goodfellowiella coeruleoviolacea]|uniref:hypothetical protein n=1 Tax=Goodfellowiella coeruleoviolacea TaxID=334858 RepID=UPI0020A306A7|nr:hypothetical protein [Goodfellowiella coeruleoviolacea]
MSALTSPALLVEIEVDAIRAGQLSEITPVAAGRGSVPCPPRRFSGESGEFLEMVG